MGKRRDRRHQAALGGGGRRMKLDLWDNEAPPAKPAGDGLRSLPRVGEAGEAQEARPAAAKAVPGPAPANPLALLDQYSDDEDEGAGNGAGTGRVVGTGTENGAVKHGASSNGGQEGMDDEVFNFMAELEESGLLREGAGDGGQPAAGTTVVTPPHATAVQVGPTEQAPEVGPSAEHPPDDAPPPVEPEMMPHGAVAEAAGPDVVEGESGACPPETAEWQAVEDPSSGEVYYWNTVSGETSWDKPAGFRDSGPGEAEEPVPEQLKGEEEEAPSDVPPEAAESGVKPAAVEGDVADVEKTERELDRREEEAEMPTSSAEVAAIEDAPAEREEVAGRDVSMSEGKGESQGADGREERNEMREETPESVARKEDSGDSGSSRDRTPDQAQRGDRSSSSYSSRSSLSSGRRRDESDEESGEKKDDPRSESEEHQRRQGLEDREAESEEDEERKSGNDEVAVSRRDEVGTMPIEAKEQEDRLADMADRWEKVAERLRNVAGEAWHSVPLRVRAALEAEFRAADCRALIGQSRSEDAILSTSAGHLARLEATAGVEEAAAAGAEEETRKVAAMADQKRRSSPSASSSSRRSTPSSSTRSLPSQPMRRKSPADLARLTAYSDSSAEDGEIRPSDEADQGPGPNEAESDRKAGDVQEERGALIEARNGRRGSELEEGEMAADMDVEMEIDTDESPAGPPVVPSAASLLQPMQSFPAELAPSDWPPPPPPEDELPPVPPLEEAPPPPPPEDLAFMPAVPSSPPPPPPPLEPEPETIAGSLPDLGPAYEPTSTGTGDVASGLEFYSGSEPYPRQPVVTTPVIVSKPAVYAAAASVVVRPTPLENGGGGGAGPASKPAAAGAVAGNAKRTDAAGKKRKAAAATVGGTFKGSKKMSSMLNKWKAVKEELQEADREPDEFDLEQLEKKRVRELEEWKAQQLAAKGAADNANFQPLGSDWRNRVKRTQQTEAGKEAGASTPAEGDQSAAATSAAALASEVVDGTTGAKPDLASLSTGLPPGWKAFWDQASGEVYYGNLGTKETSWDRPT